MKPSRIFHDGRRLALVATAVALVGGLGCATSGTIRDAFRKAPDVSGPIVMTDTIVAFGVPGSELSKKIKQPALAFIGKAHTYLLVKGADDLKNIAQTLPAANVVFTEDSVALFFEDDVTWGNVEVRYFRPLNSEFSAQQVKQLTSLGFEPDGPYTYRKKIQVEGKVFPPLSISPDNAHLLVKPRKLAFRSPPTGGGHPNLGYLALLPVALAFDIVTLPLQIFIH